MLSKTIHHFCVVLLSRGRLAHLAGKSPATCATSWTSKLTCLGARDPAKPA